MTRTPGRLVVAGTVIVDVLLYVDQFPRPGTASVARDEFVTPGAGYNLLDAAKKLGLPAAYLGFVGSGPFGAMVRSALDVLDVPVLLPSPVAGDTGFDVGLVQVGTDSQPSFVGAPGVEATLGLADLESIALLPADAVYVSGYDLSYPGVGAALGAWVPSLDEGVFFVFDPGPMVGELPQELLATVLARADLLSMNREEARQITDSSGDVSDDLCLARSIGARLRPGASAVLRAGADGCWIVPEEGAPTHISGRPASVIDTTGAGDTHLACMLARLSAGDPVSTAAAWANVAASLSVERRGPATCPTMVELDRHADYVDALAHRSTLSGVREPVK